MGNFAVYRGGDWDAKEFDTGWGRAAEDIALSLANMSRQILESKQQEKENKLKGEQMDLARKKEANDTNDRMLSRQAEIDYRNKSLANDETQIKLTQENAKEGTRRYDEDLKQHKLEFVEQQKSMRSENARRSAETAKILSTITDQNKELAKAKINAEGNIQTKNMIGLVYNMGESMFDDSNTDGIKALAQLAKNKTFMKPDEYVDSFESIYQFNLEHKPGSVKVNDASIAYEKNKQDINQIHHIMQSIVDGKIDPDAKSPYIYNGLKMSQLNKEAEKASKKTAIDKIAKKEKAKKEFMNAVARKYKEIADPLGGIKKIGQAVYDVGKYITNKQSLEKMFEDQYKE